MPSDVVQLLLEMTAEEALKRKASPSATYRLQLNKNFTFKNAVEILPYLKELGISHVYCSPYLAAEKGSLHGYNVIDYARINPEIGSEYEYREFVKALANNKLSQILDIVPNHMGVSTDQNLWWMSVLEHGKISPYSSYFDIYWNKSGLIPASQVILPILEGQLNELIPNGKIKLEVAGGQIVLAVSHRKLPISPESQLHFLFESESLKLQLPAQFIKNAETYLELAKSDSLNPIPDSAGKLYNLALVLKKDLRGALEDKSFREEVCKQLKMVNLEAVLFKQHYRLISWKSANEENNYRRFFNVPELAGMCVELRQVFEDIHAFPLSLIVEGSVSGLRIDHPDGLADPLEYCVRLQQYYMYKLALYLKVKNPEFKIISDDLLKEAVFKFVEVNLNSGHETYLYVVVEKILHKDESIYPNWKVDGTSGYDFLAKLNSVFIRQSSESKITEIYQDFVSNPIKYPDIALQSKRFVINTLFPPELKRLERVLEKLAVNSGEITPGMPPRTLLISLAEVIIELPIYRTYLNSVGDHSAEKRILSEAVDSVISKNPPIDPKPILFIKKLLLNDSLSNPLEPAERLEFVKLFQQLCAPVTAKGVEDTAFYRYNRLVSLNEVGSCPGDFGESNEELHRYFGLRQKTFPHGLSALSTHDTKRSEDVRARLNVLSEMPEEWRERVNIWHNENLRCRRMNGLPSASEEYLIYQNLLGIWPIGEDRLDQDFTKRFTLYLSKALREAKENSSWQSVNEKYENSVIDFVNNILDANRSQAFLKDFQTFAVKIASLGTLNSLTQTLIKLTAPGVPDIYQGTEVFDLSLTDPDNRREVNFSWLKKLLKKQTVLDFQAVVKPHEVKIALTSRLLGFRAENVELFKQGHYLPLHSAGGLFCDNVISYSRELEGKWSLTVAPRFYNETWNLEKNIFNSGIWEDTKILLPAQAPRRWENILNGEIIQANLAGSQSFIRVSEILSDFTVAQLISLPN